MAKSFKNPVLVGVVVTLVGITAAMTQYRVPTIMIDLMGMFGMSAQAASWLMSIFCLVMVFAAIPVSTLAQRKGPRLVIWLAVGLIVVAALIGALVPATAALLLSRVLEGIALTAVTVCCPVLVESSIHPSKIGLGLGIWGTWGPLGSTFAALLTPTLFSAMGFTPFWLLYAALVVVAAAVMAVVLRPAKGDGSKQAAGGEQGEATCSYVPRYRDVITRNTLLFFAGFIGFNLCLLATLSYVPAILQGKGYSPTVSGFVSTLPMLLSIISSTVFGILSDKLHNTRILLVVSVLFLGPCTLVLYTQTGAAMWAGALAMGLIGMGSTGLMIVGLMKTLPDPRLKTLGMGVLITVQGIGQFLGAFFVQLMLGPALDMTLRAGLVVCVLGLAATACLAFCTFNEGAEQA